MQYIYIDTKIIGAIHQLIGYFQASVFSKQNTIVYIKEYKSSHKQFVTLLQKENIQFRNFKKFSEIQILDNSIVFYLFNAQSNCRMVANRKLTHIFVTHGESNKISSVKPIIRIYDCVICSGTMGINRYLNHKIFYKDDIKRNRLIMMGNTFIGNNNYYHDDNGYILYAPTWEGGIPEENYSSLQWSCIFEKLSTYLSTRKIATLIIQVHPNLGHRINTYPKLLMNGIKLLRKNNIEVVIVNNTDDTFFRKWKTPIIGSKNKLKFIDKTKKIPIQEAFCDISAMEAQLYSKNIPTRVFWSHTSKIIDLQDNFLIDYYSGSAILENKAISCEYKYDSNFYNYIFQYSFPILEQKKLGERVQWLVDYAINKNL